MVMSKINIKLMSAAAYTTLKKNIERYITYFQENPDSGEWIYDVIKEKVFEIKKFQIEDFSLLVPKDPYDRNTDLKNAKILYNNLKQLPGYILSEPRFWLWIMFEKGYKTAIKAMEKVDVSSFKHQWLFVDGYRRGLFFGILSRLYFRVELSYDKDNVENPFHLSEFVMENPLRFREITWRTISNHKFVIRAMLKAEIRVNSELDFEEKGQYFSKLAKEISRLGSIKLIDVMDEEYLEEVLYEKYKAIVLEDLVMQKNKDYDKAIKLLSSNKMSDLEEAMNIFNDLSYFKNIDGMKALCEERMKTIKNKEKKFHLFKFKK